MTATKTTKAQKNPSTTRVPGHSADQKSVGTDSNHLETLAASVLAGFIASGRGNRAEELVEQAFHYAKLIIDYNNKKK